MGDLNYMEIAASDAPRAHAFWTGLFDWRFNAVPSAEQPYVMAQEGNLGLGLYHDDEPGLWPYFYVPDLDVSTRRVEELGGRVLHQGPVEGVGWYARCEDTEGNRFGLFQTDPEAPSREQP